MLALAALPDHPVLGAVALAVLVAAEGAFFAWYRSYRQTMPTLQGAPTEIGRAFRRYAVGVVLVVAVTALAFVLAGPILSAVVTFVTVTAGLARYERSRRDGGRRGEAAPRRPLMSAEPALRLADLDPVVHAPKRLAVMAILDNSTSTDFAFLRRYLAVSDSDLSKQMAALEHAGYVATTKTGRGRGGTTAYRITDDGHAAYRRHLAALKALTSLD